MLDSLIALVGPILDNITPSQEIPAHGWKKSSHCIPAGTTEAEKDSKNHFPAEGTVSLSGVIVEADSDTGLAKNIKRFIFGGSLVN